MNMENSKETELVDIITRRFLKEGQKFGSLKEILAAPISVMKKMTHETVKLLEEAGFVSTVGDLVHLDPRDPFKSLLEGKGVVEDPIKFSMLKKNIIDRLEQRIGAQVMRDMIIAARLIERAEKKREFYLKERKEQKIMFLGLDNAGKTAIINVLAGRINLSSLRKLKPTKRVQREKITTKNFEIIVWDLGGQKDYRESYLKKENLEMFFLQTDMIVYVIDMQDLPRLQESMSYLDEILHTLKYLGENPFILFFLHKSDPDLIVQPEFQINLEMIKDELLKLMEPYDFDYDAFPTSIYYLYSKEAKFSSFIKGVLDEQKVSENAKRDPLKAMGEVLDTAMNLTVNLANALQEEFQKVTSWLQRLEARVGAIEARLAGAPPRVQGTTAAGISGVPASTAPVVTPPTTATASPSSPTVPVAGSPVPGSGLAAGGLVPSSVQAEPAPRAMLSSGKRQPAHEGIRSAMMSELRAIFAKRGIEE